MNTTHRNIGLLAAAQSLLLANGITLVAINSLLGLQLAPDRRLATLPITTYVIGGAISTIAAAFFMKRYGRRAGFMLGGRWYRETFGYCVSPPYWPASITPSVNSTALPLPTAWNWTGKAKQSPSPWPAAFSAAYSGQSSAK